MKFELTNKELKVVLEALREARAKRVRVCGVNGESIKQIHEQFETGQISKEQRDRMIKIFNDELDKLYEDCERLKHAINKFMYEQEEREAFKDLEEVK